LILGGHDHLNFAKEINGTYVIKSGSDFKEFNKITLTFPKNGISSENGHTEASNGAESKSQRKFEVSVETILVTRKFEPDAGMKEHTDYYLELFQESMKLVIYSSSINVLIF